MKKKIFLTSLVVMAFALLFTVSAFADGIIAEKTEDATLGTMIKLSADPGLDNAAQYVSTLNNIADDGDDTQDYCVLSCTVDEVKYYYVFPSSYIVVEYAEGDAKYGAFDLSADALVNAIKEFNTAKGTSYYADYVLTNPDTSSKRLDNIIRFEFPSDVTRVDKSYCVMSSYPNLKEVRINYALNITSAEKLFFSNSKLETLIGFENVTGNIPKYALAKCTSLTSVKLPVTLKKMGDCMFQGSKSINIANIDELTSLTTIPGWTFDGCENLTITLPDSVTTIGSSAFESACKNGGSITINPTSQLKTIGGTAFKSCTALKEIYIPSTVTSIGDNAFNSCTSLTKIENLENCGVTSLGSNVFYGVSKLESVKLPKGLITLGKAFGNNTSLKVVYIPNTLTTINDTFSGTQPADAVYLYTGTDASVFAICARLSGEGVNVISGREYDETKTYEGVTLVVGYSHCIAYLNSVHGAFEFDSLAVGSYCDPIVKRNACTDCGYLFDGDKIDAPFTYKGFSTDGESIVYDVKINKDAIEVYKGITGKEFKYGIVVSQVMENGVLINSNEELTNQNILAIKLTDTDYTSIQIKILNIAESLQTTPLHCCAYLIDGDSVKYIYDVENEEGNNVVKANDFANQISYADIEE